MWKQIDNYHEKYKPSHLQIESFNHLINNTFPEMFHDISFHALMNKNQYFVVHINNYYIDRPFIYDEQRNIRYIYPNEARIRNMNYETNISVDITTHLVHVDTKQVLQSDAYPKTLLFKLPVMIGSSICNNHAFKNECEYDHGGYFILKGKERVLIAQERINYNQIYVYAPKQSKFNYIAEVRSVKEDADYSILFQLKIDSMGWIVANMHHIKDDIPLGIIFIVFGVDETMMDYIKEYRDIIQYNIGVYKHMTKQEAYQYLESCTKTDGRDVRVLFKDEILPHIGITSNHQDKIQFILNMLLKLLKTYDGKRPEDNRDHIGNKRIEMSGNLIANLVKGLFKKMIKTIQQHVEKRGDYNILNVINKFSITSRIFQCFTTGNWGIPKSKYIRQGVSQILNRLSYLGTISHLQRITIPIGKESKNTNVRQLNSTTFGFVCGVTTPEGESSGIVKDFAIFTCVSEEIPFSFMVDVLMRLFPHDIQDTYTDGSYCLFVNGIIIGYVMDTIRFIERFKELRTMFYIHRHVSISVDHFDKDILIFSDAGRILRAVVNGKIKEEKEKKEEKEIKEEKEKNDINDIKDIKDIKDTWDECVYKGSIVYIDGTEQESSVIGMDLSDDGPYDYYEIHPTSMFGICAGIIPFPEHSQAPRNIYQAAMSKQAIGMYALSHNIRFDTIAHVLHYPQKHLVTTRLSTQVGMEDMPPGHNVIVAIMCYTGFNMEDSIILNKSAVERGLFCSTSYRSHTAQEMKHGTQDIELIEYPPKEIQQKQFNYSKLDQHGIIHIGSYVEENDVLIGKIYRKTDHTDRDISLSAKANECGIVDKICVTINSSGYRLIKVKIRNVKIPEIGDKCASQHAQKGTIGMIYPSEDMPFTSEGIVPDVILNPHAIPSRMTINMLMEILCGKKCCLDGTIQDATAFCHDGEQLIEHVGSTLTKHGYNGMGYETMYNGMTGEPLLSKIFIGPCYYSRLKHLVSEKLHARTRGNVQMLSRQPCAGRSRDGGLRFGEMERDCIITHGSSSFLKERMFDMSDKYELYVCSTCGTIVNNKKECMQCGHDQTDITYIPYACKLLFQELQAMGTKITLNSLTQP